jgi:hypothetical protein
MNRTSYPKLIVGIAALLVLAAVGLGSGSIVKREQNPQDLTLDDPTNGVFEVSVVLQTNVAYVGSPLPATVNLKNIGPGRQFVSEFKYAGGFKFVVSDTNGVSVPVSIHGRRIYSAGMADYTSVELDPGQSRPYSYDFGIFFEFPKEGGVFTLRAIRNKPPRVYPIAVQPPPAGTLMLTSPPVSFTLLPTNQQNNAAVPMDNK